MEGGVAGPQPQEGSYTQPHRNLSTHDAPSAEDTGYGQHPYSADAAQQQSQARDSGVHDRDDLGSAGEANYDRPYEGQGGHDESYDTQGSYDRGYAGQHSQGRPAAEGGSYHQPQPDPSDEAAASAAAQPQASMGSVSNPYLNQGGPGYDAHLNQGGSDYEERQGSGYNTHLNRGDSGCDDRGQPGYDTHQNTSGSAYDQGSYTHGADKEGPGASDRTGGVPVASRDQEPSKHESGERQFLPHPSIGSGFTGSYTIRRRTEDSHDSGTWFQPQGLEPAPQPHLAGHVHQQAEPQYRHHSQQQPQDQQVAHERDQFDVAPSQHEPSYDEDQPPSQRSELGYSQYVERPRQDQQAAPQGDQFEDAPSQYQPSHGEYGQGQPLSQQQAEPQHSQYQHEPSSYQQQQQQQPSYNEFQLQAQQAEPEYTQYQEEGARQQLSASPLYRQEQQHVHSPGEHGATPQPGPYTQEPQRQELPGQQYPYDQVAPLSQHEGFDLGQPQQESSQYGQQHQGAAQQQDVQPPNRHYGRGSSDYHQAEPQRPRYHSEGGLQHQRDLPHTSQHGHPSQQQGAALPEEDEQYEHALPPMHAQDGQAAAGDPAGRGLAAPYHQHEQFTPQFEPEVLYESPQAQLQLEHRQSVPEDTVPGPQHDHSRDEEPLQQSDHREHFQRAPQAQQAKRAGYDEPSLQYQQTGPLYEQQESAAVQSQQGELPYGQSAASSQQRQPEFELSQPQEAPAQSASQQHVAGLTTPPAEQHIPAASRSDDNEGVEAQQELEHASEEGPAGSGVTPSNPSSGELTVLSVCVLCLQRLPHPVSALLPRAPHCHPPFQPFFPTPPHFHNPTSFEPAYPPSPTHSPCTVPLG